MSKGQKGNKEVKKPKQAHAAKPVGALAMLPPVLPLQQDRQQQGKKR